MPTAPQTSGHAPPTDAVSVKFCEDRRAFVEVPFRLYADDPNWVPPLVWSAGRRLDKKRQPFFAHAEAELFLAERQGRPVGRISAVRDHLHDAFHHDRIGFFGHFEAADEEVAHLLLQTAEDWLQEHAATELRGPIDLSSNYRTGLLVDGPSSPPAMGLPHHPPHYADWLTSFGLEPARDLWTVGVAGDGFADERIRRVIDRVRRHHRVTVRSLRRDRADWADEIATLHRLYTTIWDAGPGYVPMSRPEFVYETRSLLGAARPEFQRLLERDGEPIGFLLAVPDLSSTLRACGGRLLPLGWWRLRRAAAHATRCRVLAFGVLERWRNRGLELVLAQDFVEKARRAGITAAECGPIPDDHRAVLGPLERIGGERLRRYRVYRRPIAAG